MTTVDENREERDAEGGVLATTRGDLASQVARVAAPVREQVADVLRKEIMEKRLQPSERLVERELTERLGVSRTTVREALRELASEGLVTMVPQKGAIVAELSWEEAAEVYDVRVLLESSAAAKFAEKATEEQIAALKDTFREIERCSDIDDADGMLAAKDRFYAVLFEGAGNTIMTEVIGGLHARVAALRATSLTAPSRPEQSMNEIRAIVEAVERRDAQAASDAAAFHCRQAAKTLFGQLARLGAPVRSVQDD